MIEETVTATIRPNVESFAMSLDDGQRTFLIRTVFTSQFVCDGLRLALADWWNLLSQENRAEKIQDSFNRFYEAKQNDR